jgi:colicin import membrane protein
MSTAEYHLEFAPPHDGGTARALILAVAIHILLLLALNWGTLWTQQPQDMGTQTELWSAVPQPVAAKVEAQPEPDQVPPSPVPEANPVP